MKNITSILLLVFVWVGCSKSETSENINFINKFNETIELKNATSSNITGLRVIDMIVIDTLLLLFSPGGNNVFNVYSTTSHQYLAGFGNRGKGPNEFIQPQLTGRLSFDKSGQRKFLEIYDMERRLFTYIDIKASTIEGKIIGFEESIASIDVDVFIRKVIYKNQDFLYFMPENQARMMVYDFKNQKTLTIPFIPDIGTYIMDKNKWFAYSSSFVVHPIKEKIAAAPMLLGQIDFFDFEGEYKHSTNFRDYRNYEEELAKDNISRASTHMSITSLQGLNNYIYALDFDCPYDKPTLEANPKILKFDWNGTPLVKYILDEKANVFIYDQNNKRMYIYDNDKMENNVMYYNLE